jgi:hypothetical protein
VVEADGREDDAVHRGHNQPKKTRLHNASTKPVMASPSVPVSRAATGYGAA